MSEVDWKNLNLWQTFPDSSAEEKPKSVQLKYAHGIPGACTGNSFPGKSAYKNSTQLFGMKLHLSTTFKLIPLSLNQVEYF